jgi:hypothetical protein
VPVVPVIRIVNGATPVAQLTDRTALEKLAVQPAGTVPAVKVTVLAKPLIGVTVTLEVPATVARVAIAGADNEKSTTWKVIAGLEVWVIVGVPPVPVTVTA